VGPLDLSRLKNPPLSPPTELLDSAQQKTLQVQAGITDYSIEVVITGIHVMGGGFHKCYYNYNYKYNYFQFY